MKVFAYCLFVSLSLFSLFSHAQVTSHSKPIISKNIPINDFDSLDIQGPVNVYIDATQTHPSLQILGDWKRVFAVTYSEKNHILHLGTKPIFRNCRVRTIPLLQIKHLRF